MCQDYFVLLMGGSRVLKREVLVWHVIANNTTHILLQLSEARCFTNMLGASAMLFSLRSK